MDLKFFWRQNQMLHKTKKKRKNPSCHLHSCPDYAKIVNSGASKEKFKERCDGCEYFWKDEEVK
jgi:hypothetical protein